MTRPQTLAAAFATLQQSIDNCIEHDNREWLARWRQRFAKLVELIPSGSGIDDGPRDLVVETRMIRFNVGFHHMDSNGVYDGWTYHDITVLPCFDGIDIKISGRNRDVKDHLYETFEYAFTRHVTWDESAGRWLQESDDERYAAMARAYPEVRS